MGLYARLRRQPRQQHFGSLGPTHMPIGYPSPNALMIPGDAVSPKTLQPYGFCPQSLPPDESEGLLCN